MGFLGVLACVFILLIGDALSILGNGLLRSKLRIAGTGGL
jgi:hypothetical protein